MASATTTRMSALDGVAAVDGNGGAGHEVGGGSGQEHGHPGHVVDLAPATGGRPLEHVVVQARDLLARLAGEVRVDPAGQHGVDLDVVARPGGRHRSRQLYDAALTRPV